MSHENRRQGSDVLKNLIFILSCLYIISASYVQASDNPCRETPKWMYGQDGGDREFILQRANSGDAYASYIYALRTFSRPDLNYGSTEDAIRHYKRAAELGCGPAIYALFKYYSLGPVVGTSYNQNWKTLWPQICDLTIAVEKNGQANLPNGHHRSMMAQCYLSGLQTEKNVAKGIGMLQHAARHGKSANAANLLSEIYGSGLYGVKKDLEKEIEWQTTLEENKSLQSWYGNCHMAGVYSIGNPNQDLSCMSSSIHGYTFSQLKEIFDNPNYSQ